MKFYFIEYGIGFIFGYIAAILGRKKTTKTVTITLDESEVKKIKRKVIEEQIKSLKSQGCYSDEQIDLIIRELESELE